METVNDSELILKLNNGVSQFRTIDFARLRYRGVPGKKRCDLKTAKLLNRDNTVRRWFAFFKNTNDYRDTTKISYFNELIKYVRVCDLERIDFESEVAIVVFERHLVEQVRLGKINVNSARKSYAATKNLMTRVVETSEAWFSQYALFRADYNPTRSYSDKELAALLRVLHALFKCLHRGIFDNSHVNQHIGCKTIQFVYEGTLVDITSPLTKYFCCAFFLFSYFTCGNSTTILNVTTNKKNETDDILFEHSVLKARANKYVCISIGDNGTLDVPKYALSFFRKLLQASLKCSAAQHLFFKEKKGEIKPLEYTDVANFSAWLQQAFELKTDDNKKLKPLNTKFRASGSMRYFNATGSEIKTAFFLGNTPQVLKRHYSTGNKNENDSQLKSAALTLENAVRCSDIETAKHKTRSDMDVEVLPYEDFLAKYSSSSAQKTPLGTGCKSPFSEQVEKYRRKMNSLGDETFAQSLSCADLTNCFFCKNQVIIETIEDIWCLLSYRETIKESRQNHLSNSQFDKNYSELLEQIDSILFSVSSVTRRNAEKKLLSFGRHPLWSDELNQFY
ncbi:hypothetical protein ACFO4O_11575 [Glaciecola siphonariae]|uniref:Uncharacterized protein n=1 Tax=Glaciecola siphonariae TaxID=521012 RepID=A0ABV9LY52_9ALTE